MISSSLSLLEADESLKISCKMKTPQQHKLCYSIQHHIVLAGEDPTISSHDSLKPRIGKFYQSYLKNASLSDSPCQVSGVLVEGLKIRQHPAN